MDPSKTNDRCNKLQLRTSGKKWIKSIQLHQITPSANSNAVALIHIWYHPIHRRTCCHVTREHMQYNFMLDNSYISHLCTCFHRLPGHWPTGHCRTSSLTVIPPSLQRQHITQKTQVHLHVVVTLHTDPHLTLHTDIPTCCTGCCRTTYIVAVDSTADTCCSSSRSKGSSARHQGKPPNTHNTSYHTTTYCCSRRN